MTRKKNKSFAVCVVVPWGKNSNIERCLHSILQQTFLDIQIVVIANGNISQKDVDFYESLFSEDRVKFIYLVSCANANIARNVGVAYANSTYVAFLDSDDWWDRNHVEDTLACLNACSADFVYSGMRIHNCGQVMERFAADYRSVGNMESYCLSYMPAPTGSFLYKRDAALCVMWDGSLHRHQDYDLKARFAKKYKVVHKSEISVNVDWSARTHHNHYEDCFRLLESWRNVVSPALYQRHYINLFKGAVRDNDYVWIVKAPSFLRIKLFLARRKFLSFLKNWRKLH